MTEVKWAIRTKTLCILFKDVQAILFIYYLLRLYSTSAEGL